MNKLVIVSAAALLLGSVAVAMAADSDQGKSESAPGQQMLEKNGKGGPGGASGLPVIAMIRVLCVTATTAGRWIAIVNN